MSNGKLFQFIFSYIVNFFRLQSRGSKIIVFGQKIERDSKIKYLAQKMEVYCTEIYRHFLGKGDDYKTIVEYGCILSWMHLELNNLKRSNIFLKECEEHYHNFIKAYKSYNGTTE